MHVKPRPTSRCRVLPPGGVNGVIPEPLHAYSESFVTTELNHLPMILLTIQYGLMFHSIHYRSF